MAQDTAVAPAVLTSGTTFAQLQNGGLATLVAKIIAANPAIANPTTQATVSVQGGGSSGGLLPAGAHFVSYTWLAPGGETTVGTGESNTFTNVLGDIPRVTIPSLPTGAYAANIYLTAAAGASGSETLYATGITTATFDLAFAANTDTANVVPPTTNTTGLATHSELMQMPLNGQSDRLFNKLSQHVTSYLQGDGTSLNDLKKMARRYGDVFAAWSKIMANLQTLIVANPGTVANTIVNTATGETKRKRTFP